MSEGNPVVGKGPPGPDVSGAPKLLSITGSLYIVALILYGGRIYTRLKPVPRLGWDDYTITFALVIALIEWSLFLASVQYGVGRHNWYIPPDQQITASHLLYASEVPWSASMMFIKISIASMLLRIKRTQHWLIFLWGMIIIQIASAMASIVFQLVQCIPLDAIWDREHNPNAVCAKPESAFVSLYVNSAIAITTDLTFAVLPITFIRRMQCPLREKIILSCLMGLGVFAALASIVKTTLVKRYGITGDALWDAIDITMWSMLEEQIGIIAACIPCLKSPFERILGKLGLLTTEVTNHTGYGHNPSSYGKSHHMTHMSGSSRQSATNTGLGNITEVSKSNTQSEENILRKNSAEGYSERLPEMGIVKTTELHMESEEFPIEEMPRPSVSGSIGEREVIWKDLERGGITRGEWHAV